MSHLKSRVLCSAYFVILILSSPFTDGDLLHGAATDVGFRNLLGVRAFSDLNHGNINLRFLIILPVSSLAQVRASTHPTQESGSIFRRVR